jgi:hypothetical protein
MDGDAPYTVDNNPLTNLDQDGQTGNNLTDSLLTQGDYDASYPASTTGMSLQNGLQDAGSSPSSGGGISGFLSQLFALPGKFLSGITNAISQGFASMSKSGQQAVNTATSDAVILVIVGVAAICILLFAWNKGGKPGARFV